MWGGTSSRGDTVPARSGARSLRSAPPLAQAGGRAVSGRVAGRPSCACAGCKQQLHAGGRRGPPPNPPAAPASPPSLLVRQLEQLCQALARLGVHLQPLPRAPARRRAPLLLLQLPQHAGCGTTRAHRRHASRHGAAVTARGWRVGGDAAGGMRESALLLGHWCRAVQLQLGGWARMQWRKRGATPVRATSPRRSPPRRHSFALRLSPLGARPQLQQARILGDEVVGQARQQQQARARGRYVPPPSSHSLDQARKA